MDEARFVVAPEHREAVRARVPGLTRHRLAYRDVSSATNRLTLIAAIVPPYVVTTHTLFCLRSPLDLEAQHALCGLMNSFVANYFVRLRVSTHVTLASLDHLPMPPPGPWMDELAALAASLSHALTAARQRISARHRGDGSHMTRRAFRPWRRGPTASPRTSSVTSCRRFRWSEREKGGGPGAFGSCV